MNACQGGGDVEEDSCKHRRRMLRSSVRYVSLQPCNPSAGTVLILLGRATTDPTGTFNDTMADDGHCALTGDHVSTLGGGDATDDGCVSALLQLAARASKAC